MIGITMKICVYICATLLTAKCVLSWPTYSLQNMPQTRFTCQDKILGGYYADAETQCQMFHVCVKVLGVGVQDFRFLCPNGTAFDQEAQICADWGDVDCDQSVLYYGSDNFDLYRIGSGYESKRAPLAEEEEATFHLQRAESADIRRSKETRVDQKSRPNQPPNYTKHFETSTRNQFNNNNNNNYANLHNTQRGNHKNNNNDYYNGNNNSNRKYTDNADAGAAAAASVAAVDVNRVTPTVTKQPLVNFYTPTTARSTTTTTTTSTTTERYNDESKQDFDEIFKGSHSSHFFSNRNGGREDDFNDQPVKSKPNDFQDYSRKAETSTSGKTRVQPTRGRRVQQKTTTTTSTTTTAAPPSTQIFKKLAQSSAYQTDFNGFTKLYKSTTPTTTAAATSSSAAAFFTSTTTTARPPSYAQNRFSFGAADPYQTQEKIQPTTYNPANNAYRLKTTTTTTTPAPKYTELRRDNEGSKQLSKRRKSNEKTAERKSPQVSSYVNHKEFDDFAKLKTEQPQPFKPAQVFRPPPVQAEIRGRSQNTEPQFYRARGSKVGIQEPAPFSAQQQTQKQSQKPQQQPSIAASPSVTPKAKSLSVSSDTHPRGFASRGSINYKASTQRNTGEDYNYTPSNKKFSTLVPKDQYTPTTFKPTTIYKKPYYEQATQQTPRAAPPKAQKSSTAASTQAPTTVDPYYNPDEDDGQYHPELYEQDFPKNRLKQQRVTTSKGAPATSTTTTTSKPFTNNYQYPQSHLKSQQQSFYQKQQQQQQTHADSADISDEDELFKTAQSLNFGAASINKLRADILKAEKTSQLYNSQYSPASPKTGAPTYLPTISTTVAYSYATNAPVTSVTFGTTTTTQKPFTTTYAPVTTRQPTTIATTNTFPTTTTKRPPIQLPTFVAKSNNKSGGAKSTKSQKPKKSSSKKSSSSKRPPHADEDTSYDYAYYDSDSLSETPQQYQDYEIAEFTKTRRN